MLGWVLLAARICAASVFITEFCSDTGNNEKFEFAEITNVGSSAVNMAGWSEDDSSATANKQGHSLSALGTLAPGESAIFTEANASDFRIYWGLSSAVKVVTYTGDNFSTSGDTITLFNSAGVLVDSLAYTSSNGGTGDAGITHATRTAPMSALGLNNNMLWVDSSLGDAFGSHRAPGGVVHVMGSPGSYLPVTAVPAPGAMSSIACCGCLAFLVGSRRHVQRSRQAAILDRHK